MGAMPDRAAPRTGGRLIADALRVHGVETVFCVPGESYLEIMDGLYDLSNDIALISCRHEHGAANMAEAYAKLTGRPGVCMVTRGPGACNASIGAHTAFQDSTPMVLLVGQVRRGHMGREAFQEVDYRHMYAPLAKWVTQVERAEQLPEVMARAFHTAVSGRPGPVVLALPEDMLCEAADVADTAPHEAERAHPDAADLERLRRRLAGAERPVMIVGGGGWTDGARDGILAFAEAHGLPTCCSFRRHDLFDNTHACFVGELGLGPNPALVKRVKEADVLLVVGARLGEMTTQGYTIVEAPKPKQTLIHVHAGAEELGRVFEPALAIQSGMAEFVEAARALAPVDGTRWREWAAGARRDYEDNRRPPAFDGALDLGRVMTELNERLPRDAIVTVDAGNFSGWAQRYLAFGGGRRFLGATSGAMGYGVPAAVAAKIARPERMVVACVGDGGFGMTGQELLTAVLYGVNPVILVFNNAMYGTIRMHQERDHPGRVIGTDLASPDFAALAVAYGAHGETVERTEDFAPAFERALGSGKAAVIELRMDPDVINTRTTLTALRERAAKGR
ncbi:MAG: thiamine pyrophosphate-binding protein [Proteobacteria bacterium]|nr:thiamine pyrophosphate-binding protein [Pseudomonadota bacterium]